MSIRFDFLSALLYEKNIFMNNQAIITSVAKNRLKILRFLKSMVDGNSFVTNVAGVNKIAGLIAATMPRGFKHEAVSSGPYARHHCYFHLRTARPTIVLAGHMDTLCPLESPFQRMREEGRKMIGPGTCDMKGGLTVLIWSLKILEEQGLLDPLSLICLFNSDEEFGSPTSWKIFTGMRGKADYGLVFEAGGPGNTVVTTRKGVTRYRLNIEGKASHFGCLQGRKTSAILELAHKILAIEALNRKDGTLVANAGKAEGGLAANKVADKAAMDFEARYWTPAMERKAEKKIRKICSHTAVPGTRPKLNMLSFRPPMQPSSATLSLFRLVKQTVKELGLPAINEEQRGGVSDANWLSYAGIPTIDGLGPIGDLDFTDNEYLVTESLFERIKLVTHLLLKLGNPA
jgi:glutamate carboxypeptidase